MRGPLVLRRGKFRAGALNRAAGRCGSLAPVLFCPNAAVPRCFCRLRCAPAEMSCVEARCLFVLCPALQLANRLFSLRPASRLSGGGVSPAGGRGVRFRAAQGRATRSVGFALLNVPCRSRCSSSPGSFGLSSVPCSTPQRERRALRRSVCVLAAKADSRASK